MVLSQASNTLMLFMDRLFLSRVSEIYLAASMSGGLTQFMIGSLFIGTVTYVNAVVAQYFGSDQLERCGEAAFQAILLSFFCYPLLLALSPLAKTFFAVTGQSPEQVELGYLYFRTLIFGSIFLILRNALAGFFIGIGRTTVVMTANIAGMLVNIPANYILIFGKLGLPALGLKGAAIGTIIGNGVIFAILLLFYLRGRNQREFNTHKSLVFRPEIFKTLLRFGIPAGFETFLSVSAFNIFVQFMHSYGTRVAAAVTIAFNWDIVSFIPMLGMGQAVTALVGQNVGAKDLREARRTAYTGLKAGWVYSGSMVLLFLLGAPLLTRVFISGSGAEAEAIAALATTMLRLAAVYIMADASQIVFAGALRGAGDTRWVMMISVVLHWIFTIIAVILMKVVQADPVTVWLAFIIFIVILGGAMFLRFRSGRWTSIKLIQER